MRTRGVLGVMFIVALVVLSVLVPAVSATPAVPVPRPGNPPRSGPPPTIPPPGPVKVRFMGTVAEITVDDIWTLDTPGGPQAIVVSEDTRFVETLGEAGLGACVWVVAQVMPDGSLLALVIMVREPHREQGEALHLSGEITSWPGESLEGLWVVGDYEFLVTDGTTILPEGVTPGAGDWARVTAFRQADGSLWAKKVTVIETGIPEIAVTFTGIIEVYPEDSEDPDHPDHPYTGDWVISNITVTCVITTQVVGTPEVGSLARVKAILQPSNGDLIASKIEIRNAVPISVKFRGAIRRFPTDWPYRGDWLIGVVNVFADENTVINGVPAIGLMARVEGLPQTNGGVLATVITVEEEPPGPVEVEFDGVIERLPKYWQHGLWIVSEGDVQRHVHVTSRTEVEGTPVLEANVHVVGTQMGGVVHASEIEVNGEDPG